MDMISGMEIFLTRHGGLLCDPSALEAESWEIIASPRLLGLHGKFQARHTHMHMWGNGFQELRV